jgi:hypothetical protein
VSIQLKSSVKHHLITHVYLFFLLILFWRHLSFSSEAILPGDNADSRYTTSLYEHWYLFFQGKVGLTGNFFFYPENNSMAYSDAYLFQGILHSIFRFANFSLVHSWLLASVLTHAVGAYSSLLISRVLKFSLFPTLLFTAFWGFNSVIWVQRGHLQNLAYPLIGYAIYFFLKFLTEKSPRTKKIYLSLSFNASIISALSAAYSIVFLSLYLLLACVVFLLVSRQSGMVKFNALIKQAIYSLNKYKLALISAIPAFYLFLYIYVLSPTHLTTRSAFEAAYFSPTFSELIEVPPNNYAFGKITSLIFARSLPGTGERFMGFTISFLALFALAGFFLYRQIKKSNQRSKKHLIILTIFLTIILIEILVLRDARGFNFWYLTGAQLPFFNAIRGMSRIHQTQYMMGGLVIALIIQARMIYLSNNLLGKTIKSKKKLQTKIIGLLILGLPLLEANSYYGTWKAKEMNPITIEGKELSSCSSFALLLDNKQLAAKPWWEHVIDSQILATNIQIPTITGYSGGQPLNYSIDYSTEESLKLSLLRYIELREIDNVCLLKKESNEQNWKITER